MNQLKIIAFTHKTLGINELADLHIEEKQIASRLLPLKTFLGFEEVMLLSTCNRVELLFSDFKNLLTGDVEKTLRILYPSLEEEKISGISSKAVLLEGENALQHLMSVASSLDSLVVGEREIITQVRNAYELAKKSQLTGDLLRLVVQRTVECAKQVYTKTNIARHPVSVVSLAFRKLKELNVKIDSKILIIGAGVTNTTMAKYLKKHGFTNFSVFNRTLENGQKLARDLGGDAYPLSEINNYTNGFDVIVTCTGATGTIITKEIYQGLVGTDKSRKIVIDLAVPNDLDQEILKLYDVNLIAVNNLQEIARKNLSERVAELSHCQMIIEENIAEFKKEYKERQVELAMSEVPRKVKEIREIAIHEVFVKDIERLDDHSKETLNKVISYLEKKYISVPMKMAKEILIEEAAEK